jgi:hypothetical protein
MSMLVAVIGVVLALATVGYFVFGRQHPQDAAGRGMNDVAGSEQFFGQTNDRPGGPGSESDGVVGPGVIAPGPSAEAGGVSEPSWGNPETIVDRD